MVLSPQVCAQLCRRPCYCPWVPPRCPRGSSLVLDGCGCCKVCARRLGEPCDFLHVCDRSQGLVCDYSTGTGATCNCEHRSACVPPPGSPQAPGTVPSDLDTSSRAALLRMMHADGLGAVLLLQPVVARWVLGVI